MQFSYHTYVAIHIEKDIQNILSIFEKHLLIKIRCDSQSSYYI